MAEGGARDELAVQYASEPLQHRLVHLRAVDREIQRLADAHVAEGRVMWPAQKLLVPPVKAATWP